MGRYSGKTCRLIIMLILTTAFFLLEIVVGYITNSTALIADSFHMLSDVVAIGVGFASVRISKWPSKRNTYGWVRAEILGALVNAVFLLALCFSIMVEALKRLVELEEVEEPKLMLVVGVAGLVVNVIGLFLFWRHGHSHGGHGHSHGGHGHSHEGHGHLHRGPSHLLDRPSPLNGGLSHSHGDQEHTNSTSKGDKMMIKETEKESLIYSAHSSLSTTLSEGKEIYVSPNTSFTIEIKKAKLGQVLLHGSHGHSHEDSVLSNGVPSQEHANEMAHTAFVNTVDGIVTKEIEGDSLIVSEYTSTSATISENKDIYVSPNASFTIEIKKPKLASANWLNMKGVLLHALGDALGSVVVVISALIIMFADGNWRFYIDPSLSIVMVFIILTTTIPLLKESAFILLQTVPSHVNVENIVRELEQMDGIYGVHECHIWQLAGNRIVASAHIRCHGIEEYMTLAAKIKKLFHKAGIHSTTIQPEFIDWRDRDAEHQPCVLLCDMFGEQCKNDTCCGDRQNLLSKHSSNESKVNEVVTGGLARQTPCNRNNNCIPGRPNAFPIIRSLDMKFSPDGDEVVLEMSKIMKTVIEDSETIQLLGDTSAVVSACLGYERGDTSAVVSACLGYERYSRRFKRLCKSE